MGHEATVRRFFDELETLDMAKIAAYCADDCSYEDVPVGEAATALGPAAIRAKLEGAFSGVGRLVTTIHELAEDGDTVLVERTEVWHHPTGEQVPLPVMAVFKFRGDEIVLWRDYWDMKTLIERQPASWLQRFAGRGRRLVIDLVREGDVFVLRMEYGENRFRPDKIEAWNGALDEVEKAGKPSALVTTGTGKFYSNGLDLDWMLGEASVEEREAYIPAVLAIMARVLTFPCITVCALNGHAFGAGAQIALAHDYRVMRRDRGYFCMPEIDMGAPLHPGMTAIIQARLPHQTAHQVITEGRRYGAEDARDARIVDQVADEREVVPRAVELAAGLAGKAHPIMRRLKADMYERTLEALAAPLPDLPLPAG